MFFEKKTKIIGCISVLAFLFFATGIKAEEEAADSSASGKARNQSLDYTSLYLPGDPGNSYLFNSFKKYPYLKDTKYLYEADIVTSYLLFGNISKNKRKPYAFVMTPQIRLRMLDLKSSPIMAPSYMIHGKFYRYIKNKEENKISRTWVASLNHHSNGNSQSIIAKRELNLLEGSFSTNYFLLQHYWMLYQKTEHANIRHIIGTGYEYHFPDSIGSFEIPGTMIDRLAENFGRKRLNINYTFETTIQSSSRIFNRTKIRLSFLYTYITDKAKGNFIKEFRHPERIPNYIAVFEANYKPGWKNGLGFFLKYRGGQDYYNIYFFKNLWQLQFGIYMEGFIFYSGKQQ